MQIQPREPGTEALVHLLQLLLTPGLNMPYITPADTSPRPMSSQSFTTGSCRSPTRLDHPASPAPEQAVRCLLQISYKILFAKFGTSDGAELMMRQHADDSNTKTGALRASLFSNVCIWKLGRWASPLPKTRCFLHYRPWCMLCAARA